MLKLGGAGGVARNVRGELFDPEVVVSGGGRGAGAAGVSVPEAAVDEDRESCPSVCEVGTAGEGPNVTAVAELVRAQPDGDGFLRGGSSLAYAAHEPRPLSGGDTGAALERDEWLDRENAGSHGDHPSSTVNEAKRAAAESPGNCTTTGVTETRGLLPLVYFVEFDESRETMSMAEGTALDDEGGDSEEELDLEAEALEELFANGDGEEPLELASGSFDGRHVELALRDLEDDAYRTGRELDSVDVQRAAARHGSIGS